MATRAPHWATLTDKRRFFFILTATMTATVVAGFSLQLVLGRSTFHVPLLVHLHALVFFGWTFFFLLQSGLAATGSIVMHRRLGWLGAMWATVVVILGTIITVVSVRMGRTPFFFTPLYFVIMNPMSVVTFGALFAGAVWRRGRVDWHRRLMICAMAELTGPAWGRILPLPFLIPYAGWAVLAATLLYPAAGMIRDARRRRGGVHPAWIAGTAVMIGGCALMSLVTWVLGASGLGVAFYHALAAGSPGAAIDPLAYPLPPWATPPAP